MNDLFRIRLAVKLCSADMSHGYISVDPVLDDRDELIDQRITWYCEQLADFAGDSISDSDLKIRFIEQAVNLTCADIICDVIANEPVLYDRNKKIIENIEGYINLLAHNYERNCIPDTEHKITGDIVSNVVETVASEPVRMGKKKRKKR